MLRQWMQHPQNSTHSPPPAASVLQPEYDRETALKETLQDNSTANNAEQLPAPKGIGMAVAFDWGLTVELLLLPILMVISGSSVLSTQPSTTSNFIIIIIFLISWVIAALVWHFWRRRTTRLALDKTCSNCGQLAWLPWWTRFISATI